jgi:aryl-alcohol dehydrogenase-like predicted oxidoreductase
MQVPRLSPGEIVEDLEDSLRNLQVDTIDLYYLHRDDPTRAVAEIVDTLHAQQASGKIRYFACSNWRADRIREAQAYADAQGFQGFVADQMLWNLAVVDPEALVGQGVVTMDKELRRLHAETGMAAVPFSSQAGGLFQKMSAGTLDGRNPALTRTYPTLQNRQRFERIQHLALESGLTVSQIVLGYLLSQPFVTLPIVGCKSLPHLHDSLSAADVVLTPSQIAYLERGEVHEGGVGSS